MNSPKSSDLTRPANLLQHGRSIAPVRNIQSWLFHMRAGRYEKAWRVLGRR